MSALRPGAWRSKNVPNSGTSREPPPTSFRPGIGSALFLVVMLGAATATMLRMVVAAWQLPVADFAIYATVTATGAFLSTILSFGATEATIKNFPRLVGAGRASELLPAAHLIMRRLTKRALLTGTPVLAAGYWLNIDWLMLTGIGFFFALSTAYTLILASMQRAYGTSTTLAAGTVLRSLSVLVAVAIAARAGNVATVLIVEIIVTTLACLASERLFFNREQASTNLTLPPATGAAADGVRLFFAYALVSMPFYLDRLFVVTTMGTSEGGRYAILALFLTAASLIINTLAQRAGPTAIRLVQSDGNHRRAARQILLWCMIASVVWLGLIATAAAAISADLVPSAFERYMIDPRLLIPVAVSGVLLNTGMVEFLLISLDRERLMLRAASGFAFAVLFSALFVAVSGSGLLTLMWLLAGSRALYLCALLASLPWRRDEAREA